MAMPDAVTSLVQLLEADRSKLSDTVYDVQGFSESAGQIAGVCAATISASVSWSSATRGLPTAATSSSSSSSSTVRYGWMAQDGLTPSSGCPNR